MDCFKFGVRSSSMWSSVGKYKIGTFSRGADTRTFDFAGKSELVDDGLFRYHYDQKGRLAARFLATTMLLSWRSCRRRGTESTWASKCTSPHENGASDSTLRYVRVDTMSRKRTSRNIPPIFADFRGSVTRHFAFLEVEYGFHVVGPEVHGGECSIHYVRPSVLAIAILSEPGSRPWVGITINKCGEPQEVSLDEFLQRYCGAAAAKFNANDESTEAAIVAYSTALHASRAGLTCE